VLGQHRSTQRYRPRIALDEARLVERIGEIVRRHPRHGYRMVWWRLRMEGWAVNHKRVHRIWRREKPCVPRKSGKKRRRARAPADRLSYCLQHSDPLLDRGALPGGPGVIKRISVNIAFTGGAG
jgi:hypothetical protein